ncbi:hypothetical protein [Pararhizobium haloflavum]|uniref:hypothetical protein n=1 Tax=Pararhizobium haloflavum TaxID=2037914 RepID=UPI0012FFD6B7|nr:hypothetical protein [Pararhizobium haloflavum]
MIQSLTGLLTSMAARPNRTLWLMAVVLSVLQGYLFTVGYRLTADDVMSLKHGMDGWPEVWASMQRAATDQGRIGGYVLMPLVIYGAYFADSFAFRVLYVALFFGVFLLIAFWLQILARRAVAALFFLLLVAFSVLDYQHLSPTSYPLQNTVPFLAVAGIRLALVHMRSRSPQPGISMGEAVLCMLFALAMLPTEYAFLLGTAMLGCEYAGALVRGRAALSLTLRNRRFWLDVGSVLASLAIYLGWRLAHPSSYVGNMLADATALPKAGVTMAGHMFGLHLLPYTAFALDWPTVDDERLLLSVAVAALTGIAVYTGRSVLASLPRPGWLAALSLAAAAYVVLPPSLTIMQQEWCSQSQYCVFLDSRTAFIGIVAMFVGLMALVLRLPSNARATSRLAGVIAVLVGLGAGMVHHHNLRLAEDMATKSAVWQRARHLACDPAQLLPVEAAARFVDRDQVVSMHGFVDRDDFWNDYLAHLRRTSCR